MWWSPTTWIYLLIFFLVTNLQLLEFYQMDKPHYQIQRVKLRIIKMPMSVKKELQFRAWSRINESSSYQFIYRGKNGPFFSILLLRVIIWCFECWFSLHEVWKLSSWSTMKSKSMQGTTTLSSKFTAEREYSRKWYPKKSTVKKLYKKGRKKGEYLRISIYICNTKLRDLLSQNPPSINNQQQKKREGSFGRERERERLGMQQKKEFLPEINEWIKSAESYEGGFLVGCSCTLWSGQSWV